MLRRKGLLLLPQTPQVSRCVVILRYDPTLGPEDQETDPVKRDVVLISIRDPPVLSTLILPFDTSLFNCVVRIMTIEIFQEERSYRGPTTDLVPKVIPRVVDLTILAE